VRNKKRKAKKQEGMKTIITENRRQGHFKLEDGITEIKIKKENSGGYIWYTTRAHPDEQMKKLTREIDIPTILFVYTLAEGNCREER